MFICSASIFRVSKIRELSFLAGHFQALYFLPLILRNNYNLKTFAFLFNTKIKQNISMRWTFSRTT